MPVCKECGNELDTGSVNKTCFSCLFWLGKLIIKDQPYTVRADGNHYMIMAEKDTGMRGYGGHKWIITFKDGRVVTTTNLWHQGVIPKHFQDRLPDNAVIGQDKPEQSALFMGKYDKGK